MSRTARLWLAVVPPALVTLVAVGAFILTSDHNEQPILTLVVGGLSGASFIAAGLIARTRRPENRTGVLMIAVGFAFLAAGLSTANSSLVFTIGMAVGAVWAATLVHLLLAYPTGRLATRWERVVVITAYALASLANIVVLPFDPEPLEPCDGCPENALLVSEHDTLATTLTALVEVSAALLLTAVAVTLILRWRRASGAARRLLAPVLLAGTASVFFLGIAIATQDVWTPAADITGLLAGIAFLAVPFLFLWGVLQGHLARSGLGPLMRSELTLPEFEAELRRLLRDPTATLLVSLGNGRGTIDAEGRPAEIPAEDETRAVTTISDEDGLLGALVHDPSLRGEELVSDLAAALRLDLRRHRATAALQASERRSRALLEALPDNMYRISREGIYLDVYASDPEQLRMPIEQFIGSSVWDYPVPAQTTEDLMATAERAFATGTVETFEFDAVTSDGTQRYREARIVPSGEDEFLLITRDITDRKRAEQELLSSERRSRALVEGIPDNIFRVRRSDNTFIDVRWTDPSRLPHPPEYYLGKTVHDLGLPEEIARRFEELAEQAFATRRTQSLEYELVGASGRTRFLEARIVASGEEESFVIVRDVTDRRRAEEDLRSSEQRSRALLAAIPDAMFRISRDGTFLDVHTTDLRLRMDPELIVGSHVSTYPVPPELVDQIMAAAEAAFATGERQTIEFDIEGEEGRTLHQEARITPSGSDEFFVVIRDVTDRKQKELALQRERDFTATVVNVAPTYFCHVSESGRIIRFNDTLGEATSERDGETIRGRLFRDVFVVPEEVPEFERRLERAAAEGDTGEFDLRLRPKNGELLDVLWRGVEITDQDGERGYLLCGLDVTERARHRQELERRRDFLSAIGDATPAFLCIVDAAGRMSDDPINRAIEESFGYAPDDVRGRSFAETFGRPEEAESFAHFVASAANGSESQPEQESVWVDKDGRELRVAWTCSPLPELEGQSWYLISGTDVTERSRRQEEQAALRRVAVAVASEQGPEEVFRLVTEEVASLLGAETANLMRRESENEVTFVGRWSRPGVHSFGLGERRALGDGPVTTVLQTGKPVRYDLGPSSPASVRQLFEEFGFNSLVAAPIVVSGRMWGAVAAAMAPPALLPPGSEQRVDAFARLVSIALANAEARSELAAQRARIVSAGDEERRRLERNLHDGAQQRLVSLSLSLRLAQAKLGTDTHAADELLSGASVELALALEELRELARGIHPAVLTERGLGPALESLATRAPLPVKLEELPASRLPSPVEAAAYYVVSEALTNVSKYAGASAATVRVAQRDGLAVVEVADDGVGGADPAVGTGLRGLADRVEALEGRLAVESTPGRGTTVRAEIPCS